MTGLFATIFALAASLAPAWAGDPVPVPSPSSSEKTIREFTDEVTRDYNLRSSGQIQLTNLRGNITVQGWTQDIVRVRARRRVFADSDEAAKSAFSAMDFRFQDSNGNIECAAQYGRGLEIYQRVEERDRPEEFQSKMDLIIFAPSRSNLKIWTATGNATLHGWNSSAELRTVSGDISADTIKGAKITSLCQNCSAKFKAIKGSIRAITDGGNLTVQDVDGPEIFLESAGGDISVQNVQGEQLYVTKSGKLSAKDLSGRVEFQTQQGNVDISGLRGFASGRSDSGAIHLRADEWEFHDKAIIESGTGDITLSLPKTFAAEIDLKSDRGKIECGFPILRAAQQAPEPDHWTGRIGEQTTDLLKVYSKTGNIQVLRLVR